MPGGKVVETSFEEKWRSACVPALLPEKLIFEKPYEKQGKGWQHKIIVGYDFHPDATRIVGLMNALKDPQSSYNQRRMTMLELLMDMVNASIEAPEGSISEEFLADWQSKERGKIRFYKPKEGNKPERIIPPAQAIRTQELGSERANPQANKVMILLTDGKANRPSGWGYGEDPDDVQYAIDKATEAGSFRIQNFHHRSWR